MSAAFDPHPLFSEHCCAVPSEYYKENKIVTPLAHLAAAAIHLDQRLPPPQRTSPKDNNERKSHMHRDGQRPTLMLKNHGTGCPWKCPRLIVKRIPINNCAGKKTGFIDVSTGIGRDKVFTTHGTF